MLNNRRIQIFTKKLIKQSLIANDLSNRTDDKKDPTASVNFSATDNQDMFFFPYNDSVQKTDSEIDLMKSQIQSL